MQWVIKIGGSLYASKYLSQWLKLISESKKPIIIVPGGGPFADQVREADKKLKLDAMLAHDMAILGMQQYAYLMASLCPTLKLVDCEHSIKDHGGVNMPVIWEPYAMLKQHYDLEKTWDYTSDSLAAWLANFLNTKQLVLVKSSKAVLQQISLEELQNLACVDTNFSHLISTYNLSLQIFHKSQTEQFAKLL